MVGSGGRWDILVPPTIITYILVVASYQIAMEARVLASLRPLLDIDETALRRLAAETGGLTQRTELVAFGVGVLVAVVLNAQGVIVDFA
jgi:hypothetical protein